MPAATKLDLRKCGLVAGAVFVGLLLGGLARMLTVATAGTSASVGANAGSATPGRRTADQSPAQRRSGTRPRHAPDAVLSFSRPQWSKLLRHPGELEVVMGDQSFDRQINMADLTDTILGRLAGLLGTPDEIAKAAATATRSAAEPDHE